MRINNCILCDDIRSEVGNKKSLMGVYSKEIAFAVADSDENPWPKEMVFGLMLDFSVIGATKGNAKSFEISYLLHDVKHSIGRGLFQFTQEELESNSDAQVVIYMKGKYQLDSPGFLVHTVEIMDDSGAVISKATVPTPMMIKQAHS